MRLIRIPEKNWRPDALRLFAPGTYRVPLDMDEETADRAIAEGAAVEVEAAKPETEAAKPVTEAAKPAVEVAKPPKLETKPAAPPAIKPAPRAVERKRVPVKAAKSARRK